MKFLSNLFIRNYSENNVTAFWQLKKMSDLDIRRVEKTLKKQQFLHSALDSVMGLVRRFAVVYKNGSLTMPANALVASQSFKTTEVMPKCFL